MTNQTIEYVEKFGREQLKGDLQLSYVEFKPETWDELFDHVGADKSLYDTKFYISRVRNGEVTIELHDTSEGYYTYADVSVEIVGKDELVRDEIDGLADVLHEALLKRMYETEEN